MWEYVYHHLIIQRPWIGFGYGVIWHLVGIRNGLAVILHWRNPVLIGDNGYVDILLHIGIVGLLVLIALIVFGLIRGIKYTSQNLTLESALPVLILIALIVANIALSLILESESFMWLTNVALIVGITPKLPYIIK